MQLTKDKAGKKIKKSATTSIKESSMVQILFKTLKIQLYVVFKGSLRNH